MSEQWLPSASDQESYGRYQEAVRKQPDVVQYLASERRRERLETARALMGQIDRYAHIGNIDIEAYRGAAKRALLAADILLEELDRPPGDQPR